VNNIGSFFVVCVSRYFWEDQRYVDDPRNTDNAWMETVAVQFHCPLDLGSALVLEAADDAANVRWIQIENDDGSLPNLYASHQDFVREVLRQHQANKPTNVPVALKSSK
jgi:ADP-ribose pyrophosphatase